MLRLEQGEDPHWGEMSALRNGEPWPVSPWHGSLYAISNEERETMSILMDVFNEHDILRENLWFAGIPKRLGTYPLPGRIVQRDEEQHRYFFTIEADGDVLGLIYELDKSAAGFITIDAYDASTCTIEGRFSLTVLREGSGGVYPYVDTLRFTDGRFRTHVVTWPGAN